MTIVEHYNQQLVASGWTQLKSHSEYELYCAAHHDQNSNRYIES